MADSLKLALVQQDLIWGDRDLNLSRFSACLDSLTEAVDLIVLPEMFTSAFDANASAVAEAWPGPTLEWMQQQAKRLDAAITGSIAVQVNGQRLNRLIFVTPDSQAYYYDKRHLFRMLGEHEKYTSGTERLIVQWRGWRIFPLVCYDLRFPVWCRNTPALNYDLMLFVANWPAPRTALWTTLLKARAIENIAYVAGVNRTGDDARQLVYEGASAVESPDGSCLASAGDQQTVVQVKLSLPWLRSFRQHFPAHMDADTFSID